MNTHPKFPATAREHSAVDALRSRMNVAKLLVRARVRLGWTQAVLAAHAGTKQSRISEIESLNGNVRFDTLDRIAKAVGLEITLQPRTVSYQAQPHPTMFLRATAASTTDWVQMQREVVAETSR